jgi:molybdopterin-synthase adenylyltransferase
VDLSEDQIHRYARHIVLPEVGGIGQARLLASRVLIIGAGGLGSPAGLYLAAAGVGTLGIVDHDRVDASNLQRQIAHGQAEVGRPKVESFAGAVARLNPTTCVIPHDLRLTADNVGGLLREVDLVADGSDNFATRAIVHDACLALGITLVSASVQGVEGQLTTFKAHLGRPHPCLRCLYPEPPDPHALPTCAQGGVLGPAAGVMGTLQAVEVVKELLGREAESLSGSLLLYDAVAPSLERVRFGRRPECPACGG